MRKKDPVRGNTPLRRSTRLQHEKTGEEDSKEAQSSNGRSTPDFLQPRESIRAYRKLVVPIRDPSPSPQSGLSPASGSEPRTESRRAVLERDPPLSPFVRLRRLDVPQNEEPSPQESKEEEQPEPSIEWEVVKDDRARLRILEAKPQRAEAGPTAEDTVPNLQGMTGNWSLRQQQARARIASRSDMQPVKRADPFKPQTMASPGGAALKKWRKRFLTPVTLFCLFVLLLLGFACWFIWKYGSGVSLLGLMGYGRSAWRSFPRLWTGTEECSSQCSLVMVESIPASLDYEQVKPHHRTIYQAWMDLLAGANSSVDIAAFYFTLRDSDIQAKDPLSQQGKRVFESLLGLPSRGVKLNIAVNSPQMSDSDTQELLRQGADVRHVNMKNLTHGILHTKFWVVDQKHVYIGSANMDWRSLTQVKELGVVLYNCSCLARDLHRIFAMYHSLGEEGASIPAAWPAPFAAESSLGHPLKLQLTGKSAELYISSSPPALCSMGRTSDLEAIVSTIEDARAFVYISVMNYIPQCSFCKSKRIWPVIDNALRAAACERKVKVHLLISCWQHSDPAMFLFLKTLSILHKEKPHCPIEVKLFVFPPGEREQPQIPYVHVNHNKYMVTDRLAYIGTSNWSEDYFTQTAGVGLIVNQTEAATGASELTLRQQLEDVFLRDWESSFAKPLGSHSSCAKKGQW